MDKGQKEFARIFESISNWNSPRDRWNDMCTMFAVELANPLDAEHRAARNEQYAAVARKYKPEEFHRFSELFYTMLMEYEERPFQDFLGQMYMEMGLGNSHAGQFFTPYNICRLMAEMQTRDAAARIADNGWIALNDPTCGGGATLIAAAESLYNQGINYQERAFFVGQDLDMTVALMCYIQLSMLGCAGYVRIGDTLRDPPAHDLLMGDRQGSTWYTPMWWHWLWKERMLMRRMDRLVKAGKTIEPAKQEPEEPVKKGKQEAHNERTMQISFFP